jgi:hypothetical protein
MQSQIRRLEPDASAQPEIMIAECEAASAQPLWRRMARGLAFLFRTREFADHAEQSAFQAQWNREQAAARTKLSARKPPL